MNIIKIYTLAYNETTSTDDINHFFTKEKCFEAMVADIERYEKISIDRNAVCNALEKNGEYSTDEFVIGKDYAYLSGYSRCWEIFERTIDLNEINKSVVINKFLDMYTNCGCFVGVLRDFLREYSSEKIAEAASNSESSVVFINDCIIGECLYQRAAAELGGKTDEESTSTIFEFFNSDNFVQFFNSCVDTKEVNWNDDNEPFAHENWIYGMLSICNAKDDNLLIKTRNHIDETYDTSIFFNMEKYSDMICENHREKSSHLSDKEYIGFVEAICKEKDKKEVENPNYESVLVSLWNEMTEKFYQIAREEGYDYIEQTMIGKFHFYYSDFDGRWVFYPDCAYDDLAYFIDRYFEYKAKGKRWE